MSEKMRLFNIPPEIQKRYNVGESVDVVADSSVNGGHFTFVNKGGRIIEIDAVEIYDQGIQYEEI